MRKLWDFAIKWIKKAWYFITPADFLNGVFSIVLTYLSAIHSHNIFVGCLSGLLWFMIVKRTIEATENWWIRFGVWILSAGGLILAGPQLIKLMDFEKPQYVFTATIPNTKPTILNGDFEQYLSHWLSSERPILATTLSSDPATSSTIRLKDNKKYIFDVFDGTGYKYSKGLLIDNPVKMAPGSKYESFKQPISNLKRGKKYRIDLMVNVNFADSKDAIWLTLGENWHEEGKVLRDKLSDKNNLNRWIDLSTELTAEMDDDVLQIISNDRCNIRVDNITLTEL